MKGVREVFSQLLSKSLVSTRPLSASDTIFNEEKEGPSNENFDDQGGTTNAVAVPVSHTSDSSRNQENQPTLYLPQEFGEDSFQTRHSFNRGKKDSLVKVGDLQVKFLRLLQRLRHTQNNLLAAKVLYRIHLATLIRVRESDLKRVNLNIDKASAIAAQQEAAGVPELDFSFRILVLGRTGVGKSATINSIFEQTKAVTDAFQPATDCIREVVGIINGIKISFIDTPGFLPSSTSNMRRNKRIMLSVKRYITKYPPDMVLYFERLDLISAGDFHLLKLITEVFGTAIWFNAILVMTHASSVPLEGPDGYPSSYDSYVSQRSELVQHHIHLAISDSKLENPVLLVENHPQCTKNIVGEKILPNGQVWKSQFLLLCLCTKVLDDVNGLLKFQNSIELGPSSTARLPSLPHLLSSLLRHHGVPSPDGISFGIEEILSSSTEEDEYDELPSIRILTKSQFEKLTSLQKKEYLEELDYRETLYLKKQLRQQYQRRKEHNLSTNANLEDVDSQDDQQSSADTFLLPDMAIPPSFDSDSPVHRYRCLVSSDQWLVRPVLDPQGWDHDVGFDGINLETSKEIKENAFVSLSGQVNKDKHAFSIQSECAAAYSDSRCSYTAGLDIQSAGAGKGLIYTVNSHTILRSISHNITDCGVSLTSFGSKYYVGAKLEDTIFVGKRLKFVMNAGRMGGSEQVAYGGSIEATLVGGDYPVRNDKMSLMMTVLSFEKETVLGGNLQSEFRLNRSFRMSINANLNSRKMGQVCIKVSSSDHLQIAVLGAFTIFKALLRRKTSE